MCTLPSKISHKYINTLGPLINMKAKSLIVKILLLTLPFIVCCRRPLFTFTTCTVQVFPELDPRIIDPENVSTKLHQTRQHQL